MKTKSFKLNLNKNLKIFKNSYYWFILPLAIIFIALVCGTVYSQSGNQYDGFANIGIDFKGGTVLTVEFDGVDVQGSKREETIKIITEVVEANGAVVSTDQNSGTNALVVRYPNSINGEDYNQASKTEDMIAVNNKIIAETEAKLKIAYPEAKSIVAAAESINATASSDLIKKACLSVGIAMLIMLIYTIIRFDFFSGIAAFAMQINDIIIMLSLVIIFRIQINSSLIAGLITIVAYSINNTIVIFDRVRENMAPYKHKKKVQINVGEIVDTSVSQSLTRALFTSFTTLVTITILACWGIKSITEFALPIIFGILSGLYSSLFLAPSLWGLMMTAKQKNDAKNKSKKVKARRK